MSEEKLRFEDLIFMASNGGDMSKCRPAKITRCTHFLRPIEYEVFGMRGYGNINDINETIDLGKHGIIPDSPRGKVWLVLHPLLVPSKST
jgi:hypothetical protein